MECSDFDWNLSLNASADPVPPLPTGGTSPRWVSGRGQGQRMAQAVWESFGRNLSTPPSGPPSPGRGRTEAGGG